MMIGPGPIGDERAQRALKRSVAELAGPLVTEVSGTCRTCIMAGQPTPEIKGVHHGGGVG